MATQADTWRKAEDWLDGTAVIRMTSRSCDEAGCLSPRTSLRSLDGIHVAAARALGAGTGSGGYRSV